MRLQLELAYRLAVDLLELSEQLAVRVVLPDRVRDLQGKRGLAHPRFPGEGHDRQVPGVAGLVHRQQLGDGLLQLLPPGEVRYRGGQLARHGDRVRPSRLGLAGYLGRRRAEVERRVAGQDGTLEFPELLTWIEAE